MGKAAHQLVFNFGAKPGEALARLPGSEADDGSADQKEAKISLILPWITEEASSHIFRRALGFLMDSELNDLVAIGRDHPLTAPDFAIDCQSALGASATTQSLLTCIRARLKRTSAAAPVEEKDAYWER